MLQASQRAINDPALVRRAQLGELLLDLLDDNEPVADTVRAANNLLFGMEAVAQLPAGAAQDTVIGYLIEVYGLGAVYTDPFLRPLLPTIPETGATIRYKVRAANGHASGANGNYIAAGAELVPTTPPVLI